MADTVQTGRDLLGSFPLVRRIEVELVALDLHRLPDALPSVERHANEIEDIAQKSGAVTGDAVHALAQNNAAMIAASNPVLRGSLLAGKLLVVGNFARAVAETVWARGGGKGVGMALEAAPLMLLGYSMAGSVGALAMIPAFGPLSSAYAKIVGKNAKAEPAIDSPNVNTSEVRHNARPRSRREPRKTVLPKAAIEALLLIEANKTAEWAHLNILRIRPGIDPGSWELEAWGQSASQPPQFANIPNLPVLDDIVKRLSKRFALSPD